MHPKPPLQERNETLNDMARDNIFAIFFQLVQGKHCPRCLCIDIKCMIKHFVVSVHTFDTRYQQEKQDYEKRVQEGIGSDRFASRLAQTVNWALKTKEVGPAPTDTMS